MSFEANSVEGYSVLYPHLGQKARYPWGPALLSISVSTLLVSAKIQSPSPSLHHCAYDCNEQLPTEDWFSEQLDIHEDTFQQCCAILQTIITYYVICVNEY